MREEDTGAASTHPIPPSAYLFHSFLVYLTIDQSTARSPPPAPLVRSESARGALEAEHEALRASCAALARELDAQQVPEPFSIAIACPSPVSLFVSKTRVRLYSATI